MMVSISYKEKFLWWGVVAMFLRGYKGEIQSALGPFCYKQENFEDTCL